MKKFLSNKKVLLISGISLMLITLTVILFIMLRKEPDNKDIVEEVVGLKYKEGYAVDTKESIEEGIYQLNETTDITYNLYGEIGWRNFNCMKETDKYYIYAYQDCNDSNSKYDVCSNEESVSGVNLSSNPYVVKNHYIVSLDSAYDSKGTYHMEGAVDDFGTFWLTAYAELPEGTLISISTYNSPKFQINIYDKETRIIISDDFGGAMYFRVPDLNGRILTVQVGNKIFKTSGNSEFLVYSKNRLPHNTDEEKEAVSEFFSSIGIDKTIENIDEIYSNIGIKTGGFVPVSGEVYVLNRGTSKETKISNEYRFMYYRKDYKNIYNLTDDSESNYFTYEYLSVGKEYNDSNNYIGDKEFYGVLKDQKNLNKTSYGFNKIINRSNNSISSIMKNYVPDFLEYSLNIIRDYNSQRAKNSVCGNDFLDILENCGCKDGWYNIKGVGCCPNGYTYSESMNQCVSTVIVSSCPSGTYSVGGDKCCPTGTTLSSNGLSCVTSKGKKSSPSYFQSEDNNATKDVPTNIDTSSNDDNGGGCVPQTICEPKDERSCSFYGLYEKNGQCCIDLVCVL